MTRWSATLLAAASLTLWTLTFWAWIDASIFAVSLSVGHGTLTIEQSDTSFTWANGGVIGPTYPARVRTFGESCSLAWTWLDDLPGYALVDRWAFMKWTPGCGSVPSLLAPVSTLSPVSSTRRWYLDVPLWIPFALGSITAAIAWRKHLRRKTPEELAACPRCGYDLRGLSEHTVCPECAGAR